MEERLLYFALKYLGDFNRIYKAILNKETVDEIGLLKMKKKMNCSYTTIISPDYPKCLKEIDSPPFVLFYYGNLSLCNKNCISMIGGRECSDYGKQMALSISAKLASREIVIVSGMAKGIDAYSHLGAMRAKGHTIAVLGSGIDYCYPKENWPLYQTLKEKQLIISEYPGNMVPRKECFPVRNRIVAGLGQKLLVVEAKQRSGTMITVNYSLEQGKDVYCVPNRIGEYDGCNRLISQGANIMIDVEDMF